MIGEFAPENFLQEFFATSIKPALASSHGLARGCPHLARRYFTPMQMRRYSRRQVLVWPITAIGIVGHVVIKKFCQRDLCALFAGLPGLFKPFSPVGALGSKLPACQIFSRQCGAK